MKPKIGTNTLTFDSDSWYKCLEDYEFEALEINAPTVFMRFDQTWLNKIKPHIEKFDLSMHSDSVPIFTDNEQYTKTNLNILRSEIIACETWGVKQIIFHLGDEKITEEQEKTLREIIDFSKEHNVELVFESNWSSSCETTMDFLNRFPDINYNFDLGHIYVAYVKGILGCEIDEFIAKVRNRTVHMHAHGNDGTKDQHKALRDGKLDWRHVLDQLDMTKLRKIIMELKSKEDIQKTKEDLENYFSSKA